MVFTEGTDEKVGGYYTRFSTAVSFSLYFFPNLTNFKGVKFIWCFLTAVILPYFLYTLIFPLFFLYKVILKNITMIPLYIYNKNKVHE